MFATRYKLLSSLIIFMFLFTVFPAQAIAAPDGITVEKAITIVKTAFEVPDAYSKFTSGTRSEGDKKFIYLNWESPENNGRFEAQVDGKNGEIVSMYRWDKADEQASKLPVISRDRAVKIAQELLKKAVPGKAGYLRLIQDSQVVPISGYGSTLNLRFLRYQDNIPVENDTASVDINMATGQVSSYYLNWSDIDLPASKAKITAEKAGQVFSSEKMLELQYLLRRTYSPEKTQPPKLVYTLNHRSNGMIDANNGQPVILDYGYGIFASKEAVGGMGAANDQAAALTPEEIEEISKLENMMSQSEADLTVRKLAEIPEEAALHSASLNQNYQDPSEKIWSLNYRITSETSPVEYYASLNAESGELLNFHFYYQYSTDEKAILSREEGLRKAESWLKKVQPEKFSQLKLLAPYPEEEQYESYNWNFNYQRLVNNVPCPANGINGSVDRKTGKVNSYNLNWSKASFPGSVNVMGLEKANAAYLSHMPMTLVYVKEADKNGKAKFRLVYMPRAASPAQSSNIIDAVTGVKLDWEGKELKDNTVVQFDDIDGHFAKEQIEILGQSGIMTEYGSSFHPGEAVKLVTVLKAMIIANDGPYNSGLTDEEVMKRAVERNWVEKGEAAESQVSRARMAKLMVSFLRLDFVAKNGDMFILPFKDAAQIPAELKGYAGLAKGLGLISGSGENFEPGHITTRGETAAILVRTLEVKPSQNYYW